jgi:hypothetical protein
MECQGMPTAGVAKPGGNNMNRRDGKHSGMPETFETAAVEIKSIAVRKAAKAETLATTGSHEPSTVVITTTKAGTQQQQRPLQQLEPMYSRWNQ